MKEPLAVGAARGSSFSDNIGGVRTPTISETRASAQAQLNNGGIHCGAVWKSPRDKRQCVQASIKSFDGSPPYLDLRIFELDAYGCMKPTHKGITVSMARLPALGQLIGGAVRKAYAAGLLTSVSS
jgi:hypothetical protein